MPSRTAVPCTCRSATIPLATISLVLFAGCAQRDERSATTPREHSAQPRREAAVGQQAARPPADAHDSRPPATSDETPPPEPAPPQRPPAQDAGSSRFPPQPAEASERPRSEPPPPPPTPAIPPFVRLVEPLKPGVDSRITAEFDASADLIVTTENVRRFRILRRGMPMPQYRNLIVRVDKQNIEWTERFVEIELEQARSGLWEVVRSVPANR